MPMDLGMRDTLLYDSMHCTTAVSLEMSDEPKETSVALGTILRTTRSLGIV